MKKITQIILILSVSFSFGQNILALGDFENTNPATGGQITGLLTTTSIPWATSMTAATRPGINDNVAVAHAGNRFMNLPNDFMTFRQPFTAVAGTQYTLKFWNQFIASAGQPAASDGIFVSIRIPGGTNNNGTPFDPVIQLYIDPSTTNSSWNEYTLNFVAPQADLLLLVSKQSRVPTTNPNNACRMDDFSIVASPLSVNEFNTLNFNVYPNPANDFLNISAADTINTVEIFNMLGQNIFSEVVNATSTQINISNLAAGNYVLKTSNTNSFGVKKFIKN